jgi:hypothetical protein
VAETRTQSGKDTLRNVLALDAERRLHERADQQLEIQSAISRLGRDLNRAAGDDRATRTKLGDLERRIRKLQSKARAESEPFADNEVRRCPAHESIAGFCKLLSLFFFFRGAKRRQEREYTKDRR